MTRIVRILLVEDQLQVRKTLERALRFHGFDVTGVEQAVHAQDLLLREPIDLLVTDVSLSGAVDGFALAEWARGLRPALPMIVISGLALTAPPAWLLEDRAIRLLRKPFLMAALLAVMREVLRTAGTR